MISRKTSDLPSRSRGTMLWLPGQNEARGLDIEYDEAQVSRRNPSGIRITPENALYATAVMSCVRCLAESVASLKVGVYITKGDLKSRAVSHYLDDLISSAPNPWQTSYEFFETIMLHLTLYGNSYHEKQYDVTGNVVALLPLHPSRMLVEEITQGRFRYIYREANGTSTVYEKADIVHIRWLSDDGIHGMVPVELSRDAIALARACELHGSTYFGNGARPGVVLETDNAIDPEAATHLRDNWERVHKGVYNSWKTAVLTNGLKAHELGGNNQESQYLEVRRFQVEEVCRVYRVPPHMVMDLNRATFSNIEQQSLDYLQFTITPWLRRLEQALTRDVVQKADKRLAVEFDTKSLMRADAAGRAAYYNTLATLGVLSVNEIRAAENMNPVEGGDQRFVQLNMTPLPEGDSQAVKADQNIAPVLASIASQVAAGTLPRGSAIAIIVSAYPSISPEAAELIVPSEPDRNEEVESP